MNSDQDYESTIERCPHDKENPYTMLSNDLCRDSSISFECRGLLAYLLTNAPGWKIKVSQVVGHIKPHAGRNKVWKIFNEAIEAGYIKREIFKVKIPKGGFLNRYRYFLSEKPKFKNEKTSPKATVDRVSKNVTDTPKIGAPRIGVLKKDQRQEKKVTDHEEETKGEASISPGKSESEIVTFSKKSADCGRIEPKEKKPKLTDEQHNSLEWLESLNLGSKDYTLRSWAKKYSIARLQEVYEESSNRGIEVGAYMHDLLKGNKVCTTGRVKINRQHAEDFKSLHRWESLEMHQKYATIDTGYGKEEIDFNMDHEQFKSYLDAKYDTFEGEAMNNRKAKRRSDE